MMMSFMSNLNDNTLTDARLYPNFAKISSVRGALQLQLAISFSALRLSIKCGGAFHMGRFQVFYPFIPRLPMHT